MHTVGRLIPASEHRAPAIEPIGERWLRRAIAEHRGLARWHLVDTTRISSGFYISQAVRLIRR